MLSVSGGRRFPWLVGIDFGADRIKAVALRGAAGRYSLDAMASIPTPKSSIVDHQLVDVPKVAAALRQLRRQLNCRCDQVATAVAGSGVTTRIIAVPRHLSPDELEHRVLLDAEQHFPFPLDEISLDYERLGPNAQHPEQEHILLSAARTETISTRLHALRQVGWHARVVDIGVHALARSVNACLAAAKAHHQVLALVDIGAENLTFAIMDEGEVIHSRLQNFGGAHFTRALCRCTDMPEDKAERAKIDGSLPQALRDDIEQQHVTALLQHLRRNVQLFCSSSGDKLPTALFLCGGGSRLPALAGILARELGMPVLQPDFGRLFEGRSPPCPGAASYMTALGLALRSFTACPT